MSNQYRVIQNAKGSFDILEVETDVTIVLNTDEKNAKEYRRKLSLGKGFNGETPEFFANYSGKALLSELKK